MKTDQPTFPSRLEPWMKLIVSIGGVISLLWAALMLFKPMGKVDLNVQIRRDTSISLPSGVRPLPLRLVFEGRDITRASIHEIEIFNSGTTPIGDNEKKWRLDLRNKDGGTIVALGAPRPNPSNRHVVAVGEPRGDMVSLEIGLFNPRDTIHLEIMRIEPKDGSAIPIVAETQIPGLSNPYTGRLNVRERLRDAFMLPIMGVAVIGLCALVLFERRQFQREGKSQSLGYVHTIPGAILMSFFAGGILAGLISNALAWFAADVLKK